MKKLIISFIVVATAFICFGIKAFRTVPDVITEKTKYDTDDPAIWVNQNKPEKSIVFGTDKHSDGAIYAFDLNGKIIQEKVIKGLKRPNNIDIRYNFRLNDSVQVDVLVFTERERQQIRIFSLPDMKALDDGGLAVFKDENNPKFRNPMGISLYSSPIDEALYVIVGRKKGPKQNYLYQYKLEAEGEGVSLKLIRKFGEFSGKQEIEAIAVDDELGHIYYSDETHCIRKYYAEPSMGNNEIACFGGENFKGDIEGIAIAPNKNGGGYIIVSNQDKGTFNIFSREDNKFFKEIDLNTKDTDGCEIVVTPLNSTFKNGLFVAMNNNRNFYFYDISKLDLELPTTN